MIIAVCVYVACIYLMNLANSVNALTAWKCVSLGDHVDIS